MARTKLLLLIISSLLFAGVISYKDYRLSNKVYFVIEIEASTAGASQIFFDTGSGYNEKESSALQLRIQRGSFQKYSFRLPGQPIKSIRFDPINSTSVLSVKKARIENAMGKTLKTFPIQSFRARQQISRMDVNENVLVIHTTENANDPTIEIESSSFDRNASWVGLFEQRGWIYAGSALLCFLVMFLVMVGISKIRYQKVIGAIFLLANYLAVNPKKAIVISGVVAAIASCYPVVFCDKSFVAPVGVYALYDSPPWIPGFPIDAAGENFRGVDVGATAWSIAPNSVVQHDSLFRYFEFPFWNRYVGGGIVLFEQGYSMIGDVLQWIPVFLDGSALGWDIKFVLSKVIFAVGMGLLVFRLTDKLIAGSLIAISSCFLGFYAFRFNHPAIFVLTYAPWVVLQWDRLGRIVALPNTRVSSCVWQGILLAAITWLQLNAGTPKEGVITSCFMQAFGVVAFLVHIIPKWGKVRSFVFVGGFGVAMVMLTAPYWLLFLDALGKAFTSYDIPTVNTFASWMLIGFFDNYFIQQENKILIAPSVNLFILFGMASAMLNLRTKQSPMVYAGWGLFFLAMAAAYSFIPESILIAIPFINKIQHVGNTFSVPMMVLALIIAGYGVRDYFAAPEKHKKLILLIALSSFLGVWVSYAFNAESWRHTVPFVIFTCIVTLIGFLQLYRHTELAKWTRRELLILMCCFLVLHVRHGMHLTTGVPGIDNYVMNPSVRPDFSIKSDAVEYVKDRIYKENSPMRVIGEGYVLFPGMNARYNLEGLVPAEALRNPKHETLLKLVDYPAHPWGWLRLINSDQIASRAASLDLLGVGYMVAMPGVRMPDGMKLVHTSDLDVWQRESVWPRAFFVNKVMEVNKPTDILDALADKSHTPFAAVESQFIPQGAQHNNASYQVVPATEYKLTNNSTNFSVEATGAGIIVLSETYYPGDFVAKLNREKIDYIRVNEAFKGIWVNKAGKYEVSFTYRPEKLNQALWLSLFGLALLFLLIQMAVGWSRMKISTNQITNS